MTPHSLIRRAAVFLPADVPREGTFAFWSPDGEPEGDADSTLTVVLAQGAQATVRTVPATRLTLTEALALLAHARREGTAHPATRCWAAAALHALGLVARGRLLPGLTAADQDAWRVGPLDPEDVAHLRSVAAALPVEGYATPVDGSGQLVLPQPEALIRAFLDAVADTLPRTPAGEHAFGAPFAGVAARPLAAPGSVRAWAAQVAEGTDAGVAVSLRLDLSALTLFDASAEPLTSHGAELAGSAPVRRAGSAIVQVHSRTDPTLITDAALLWAGEASDLFGPRARSEATLALRRAGRVWPPLTRLLEQPVPDVLALSDPELEDLLGSAAGRLAAAGVSVQWPRELTRALTVRAVVRPAPGSATDGTAFFEAGTLFAFAWEAALGEDRLTTAEMEALADAHRPVVRLRDQYVRVDPELVRKLRKRDLGLLDPVEALSVALSGSVEVDGELVEAAPLGALADLRNRLGAGPPPLAAPAGLAASLRGYQLQGLAWLAQMTSLGLGGCLADDMGLGKTVTLIALHLHRRGDPATAGPTLVVCPASLLGNWQREIKRFAPGVAVRRFHGVERSLQGLVADEFVLTTYGTLRASAGQLAEQPWGLVVADEAQHVKNPRSATARALRMLPGRARVALTGTPVENNLSELWAILDWTTPGLLGPLTAFRARHARAAEQGEDAEAVARLARLVRPFLLRRRKCDPGIAPELPPKTESDHPVSLTREQVSLYRATVEETMALIEGSEGIGRRGLIMKLLSSLKQICNHPAQFLKEERPTTANRSGKLALLDELVDTIVAEGGAVLVFTQYVTMARLIEEHLRRRGVPTELLHGATAVPKREELVDRFQEGAFTVFLLSLKAAGTGLNLTRAGHVIHYDRWWNPAVEEQATDRAHRIGQSGPVQVHRLIAEGTVEDHIAELLTAKRALADAVLGHGESALTELTDAELADLVALRRPG
ncbi:DEAD/DEAH box helicase [Streptomyces sp. NPDC006879]|uniref:DEAD/DEAH box helicase n=1 Tax=Streptomyces sp. NPDC006879 TaxID=3364767 RepID=UPI0036ADB7E0